MQEQAAFRHGKWISQLFHQDKRMQNRNIQNRLFQSMCKRKTAARLSTFRICNLTENIHSSFTIFLPRSLRGLFFCSCAGQERLRFLMVHPYDIGGLQRKRPSRTVRARAAFSGPPCPEIAGGACTIRKCKSFLHSRMHRSLGAQLVRTGTRNVNETVLFHGMLMNHFAKSGQCPFLITAITQISCRIVCFPKPRQT